MSETAETLRERWSQPPPFTATLPNLFRKTVEAHGDNLAIVCGAERLTYAELDRRSAALARALLADGVGKATRVGILLPNSVEWLVAFIATTRIGALAVLISTLYPRKELEWLLRHADVSVLISADRYMSHDYAGRLEEMAPELGRQSAGGRLSVATLPYLRRVIMTGPRTPPWADSWDDVIAHGGAAVSDALLDNAEASVTPADLSLIMYTSGSTADPKGVVHTHGSTVTRGYRVRGTRCLEASDSVLIVGPLCWAGRFLSMLLAVDAGAALICPATPKLDDAVDTLIRERPTWVSAQEVLMREMRQHPKVLSGAVDAALAAILDVRDQYGEVLAPERYSRGLGMTETVGPHSYEVQGVNPPDRPGAYGRAAGDIERVIVDPETGAALQPGEVGELHLRGPHLMSGYYKKERWEVFDADGWFNTSDLCRIDAEGHIYFIGRNNDMIKTSGANVSPMEVERAIEVMPEVQEVGVFSLPAEGHDQIVAAVVVLNTGAALDAETLRGRIKAEMSSYKAPKKVYFRAYEDLPRTGSGKLDRRRFRAQVLEEETAAASASH